MTLRAVKCFLNNPQNIKCQGEILIQLVNLKYALLYHYQKRKDKHPKKQVVK